jgi:hypothetical protein
MRLTRTVSLHIPRRSTHGVFGEQRRPWCAGLLGDPIRRLRQSVKDPAPRRPLDSSMCNATCYPSFRIGCWFRLPYARERLPPCRAPSAHRCAATATVWLRCPPWQPLFRMRDLGPPTGNLRSLARECCCPDQRSNQQYLTSASPTLSRDLAVRRDRRQHSGPSWGPLRAVPRSGWSCHSTAL